MPIPALIGPSQWYTCNVLHYDVCGDNLQTCKVKSAVSQVHDWVVYRLGGILGSVGHKVKIHKITPVTGKERGDLEIKDYVILQKPHKQTAQLPPPRTLIMDFTMTHPLYGRSHVHPIGQLTNIRCSDGAPEPDGTLRGRGWRLGKRFFTITNCTLIDLTPSLSYHLQLTHQTTFMTTFFVYCSHMCTVKHRI